VLNKAAEASKLGMLSADDADEVRKEDPLHTTSGE